MQDPYGWSRYTQSQNAAQWVKPFLVHLFDQPMIEPKTTNNPRLNTSGISGAGLQGIRRLRDMSHSTPEKLRKRTKQNYSYR